MVATGFSCTLNCIHTCGCPVETLAHCTLLTQLGDPQAHRLGVICCTWVGSSFEACSACPTIMAMGSAFEE